MTARDEPAPATVRGLAAERTALAWSRSGLAAVGCVAVLARRFVPFESRADQLAALVLLGVAGLGWALALAMSRRRAGALHPQAGEQHAHLRLIALSTTVIGLAAFLLGVFATA